MLGKIMASEIAEVKPIQFFKIILAQNLLQGNLRMPRKFVEKYGKGLPKAICLKTPNGAKWRLNLVKSDGKIWFEKGWKQFAEHHSIGHGHLLLFRYEKTSKFEVQIFGKSALEIDYSFKRVESKKFSNGQGNKPPNGENCRAAQKRKANSSSEFHRQCEIASSSCVKFGKSQKLAVQQVDRMSNGKQVITTAKKVTTLERAQSFKICNPSFVVVMGASYVERRFLLNIPCLFGKTHFDLNKKREDIQLQALNGRVWSARYSTRNRTSDNGIRFELTSGWEEFAKDNNLKVGDVCKFELISSTILTFIVHVFRETDNDKKKCSTSQSRMN
ncbi:putative transcription factor B3-Domain family [Medicago truncatula]|nr:Transcriptional factor B3 [Medicago truncatula]RHN45641.1 putative transcription factor B3-Domain family [Medicago truncatula]